MGEKYGINKKCNNLSIKLKIKMKQNREGRIGNTINGMC